MKQPLPNKIKGYTQNRELSWLKFNRRVLEEATDETVPLLERLKFVEIFTSNLDEFFMVRVGSLNDMSQLQPDTRDNKSNMTPKEQLEAIYASCRSLYAEREEIFNELEAKLAGEGLRHRPFASLSGEHKQYLEKYFDDQILPVLSPQVVGLHHPFPKIKSKAIFLAALLKRNRKTTLGLVPINTSLPRYVLLPGEQFEYILPEEIVSAFVVKIFPNYPIVDQAAFAITRNADISPDDEEVPLGLDYIEQMKKVLKKRGDLAPVRLELQCWGDSLVIPYLTKRLGLTEKQVYTTAAPLSLGYVYALEDNLTVSQRERLCYPAFQPVGVKEKFGERSLMEAVREQDILLSYPYEDFGIFLQLIKEAVYDPEVISLKITVYRIGKGHVKLMSYMLLAAEMGKDVTVLLELKARFDEENNMGWVESLREAGCHIMYGFDGYKVHAKVCLITARHDGNINYITHIGTGNFNAKTARLYTDYALITADEGIGRDATQFFRNMGIANLHGQYEHLLVAPVNFKKHLLELIKAEKDKGERGRIILKMNSLTDREMIDALVEAGKAGVKIDMIVRGICCLVPEIPGETENIRVRSIVGRFLEHARVFVFGAEDTAKVFISSADWMTRNTENRVEVACPIYNENIRYQLIMMLGAQLNDGIKARIIDNKADYQMPPKGKPLAAQDYFLTKAGELDKL